MKRVWMVREWGGLGICDFSGIASDWMMKMEFEEEDGGLTTSPAPSEPGTAPSFVGNGYFPEVL